ncbi:MAG TPA: NlpC/P60 family protein [Polyangiaceae bacterium]|nr:NlpC/P60 family protein [Polyangiaceae bacterium]
MKRATAVLLLAGLWGCSSRRQIPKNALVLRAHVAPEPSAPEAARAAVAFAAAQIGKPYCWGGGGPGCFDCSGLAQAAWSYAGVRLPRTSHDIADSLDEVPVVDVRAGDILWWPGHVGIYAGSGWVIDALDSQHGVVVRPAVDPYRAFRPRA